MKMTVVQMQTLVYHEKEKSLQQLDELFSGIPEIRDGRADLVALPEMFNTPYETSNFPKYAEPEGGETWQACAALAKKYGVYLSAGSISEQDETGHIYNTAYFFDRSGHQIGKHRKVHLFDIDVKGGQSFRESDTLTAGDEIAVFNTEFGPMGICICFDCRFPEICRIMVEKGAKVILVPAAFNMTTGPAHWDILFRQRAVDNQCFMIATSDARDMNFSYHAWGHSMVVSPWGTVLAELNEKPGWQVTQLDLSQVDTVRQQLPLLSARRRDLYEVKYRKQAERKKP